MENIPSDIPMRIIEEKILDFVARFCLETQRSPTLAEIAKGIGYRSRGSVHRYVKSLIEAGYLSSEGANRNLQCTPKSRSDLTIPLLGRIAAGRPIEAIPETTELDVTRLFAGPERFVLQVQGDSMIEAGIHDQDYVVVQRSSTPRRGDIVVALVDGDEATLKRYLPLSDHLIELVPENRNMSSMRFPADRVLIQGVVVGQMRAY